MTEAAQKQIAPQDAFADGKWVWEKHYPKGIDWAAPFEAKPLFNLIDEAVKKYPQNTLCDFLGKTTTYADMAVMINKVAKGLQKMGVRKGVKVGLFLPNTPYSIMFYFGVLKAGGTVVNYNPLYVDRELIGQINDSETDIMVTVDLKMLCDKMEYALKNSSLKKVIICSFAEALPLVKKILFPIAKAKDIANVTYDDKHIKFSDVINNDGNPDAVSIDVNDTAVLQYTGGTTGIPKGAELTHANLYVNAMQILRWVNTIDYGRDIMVGVLPLFHVFAMTVVMNTSIAAGLKIILHPKFDVKELLKTISRHKPTMLPAVPAIFNAIASSPDVGKVDFSCLKFCISGGAPLPLDVKRLFEEKTGSKTIAEGYGLTECAPGASFNPAVGTRKNGSVGMPVPGTTIEIISRDDGITRLPIGEKGEVCISGDQVMKGYYKQPQATADVIKNGRLHTGDVGYLDEEGYLFLVDRIKDLILVRGYNVYPRIVEEAIYLHPAVEECIVAGVPDAERGETVHAWVKPAANSTVSEGELMVFLKDKISPIEMPRKIVIRSEPLPKTAVGKLSRKDLLIQEGIKK